MNVMTLRSRVRFGRLLWFGFPGLLAALALLVLLSQPAFAAGVVGDGTPGSCTETALDVALAGGGSITFNCGNSPIIITLTSQKVISLNTTIDGGDLITLDGNDSVRLFYINTSAALTLTNLTISGGSGSSTQVGYGGGIFNDGGTLSVINSTISDNHATLDGGGIYNTNGPLLVKNSTFFNNSASGSHAGGGIEIVNSTAEVSNSTFSGNYAVNGGDIDAFSFGGTVTLNVVNSTFSGNSTNPSGIRNNGGKITLKNTIVANSVGLNCDGEIEDGGGNLQYGGSVPDSCGSTIPIGNPHLAALADNGGPTLTMALLAGSAALNAADNTTCAAAPVNNLDQRGYPRWVDSQCDIGAFEYDPPQAGPVFTVNDISGSNDGVCGVGNCRLREAITAANLHAGADSIELAAGAMYTLTVEDNFDIWGMGNGLPVINSDITINAHNATIARSQANGTPNFRLIFVQGGGGILRLNQATIRGGDSMNRYASGIQNENGILIITDSTFSNNVALIGGAIWSSGMLTVTRSTFSNNHVLTGGNGGGLYCFGTAVVVNSTFAGNSGSEGSAIYSHCTLTVINSTFSNNSGASGIYIDQSTATLKNTIIANNGGANCTGTISDGGGNLQFGGTTPDSCGATIPTGNPRLGSLANNGGSTWTMALQYGSAAIDAAINTTCADAPVNNLDQRSVNRPIGENCDIGAYESPLLYGVFLPLIQ